MRAKLTTAAVVLAAGRSARMGADKPLLPLGGGTALERVVRAALKAGVDEVLVVTGHRADDLAPVLINLGVAQVHNPDHENGMFSSVRSGVSTLRDEVDGFLLLPVDCALVRAEVMARLLSEHRKAEAGILHPTCCGRRGHPPLLSARYRRELAAAGDSDDLRAFFRRHSRDEREVEVEDLTILMDMDTPEGHSRLQRFAALLDRAGEGRGDDGPGAEAASLSPEDALHLLSLLAAPDKLVRHSKTVAAVGVALAEALKVHLPALEVELVRSACLLHDLAKGTRGHAAVAQRVLTNLGLRRLGSLVGSHMVMPLDKLGAALPTEEQLVYLADRLVLDDKVVGLDERTAQALERHRQDPEALSAVETRIRAAATIRDKVEAVLGTRLEEALRGVLEGSMSKPLGRC